MKIAQRQSVQSQAQFLPKQFNLQNILDKSSKQCAQELNTLRTILLQQFSLNQWQEDNKIKQTFNQLYIYRLSNQKIALLCIALCFCGTNYLNYIMQSNKKNGKINIIRKIIKQFSYTNISNPISDIRNNLPGILIRLQMFKSEIFDNLDTVTARQHFYNYLIKKQGRNQNQQSVCKNMAQSIQKLSINFMYKDAMDDAFKVGVLRRSQAISRLGRQTSHNYLYLCPITLDGTYNYWIICAQTSKPSKQAEFMEKQAFMTIPRLLIVETCEQGQEQKQMKEQTNIKTVKAVKAEQQQRQKQQIEIPEIKQKNSSQQIIALLMLIISMIFCLYDKDCQQLIKQLFKFK